MRIRKSNPQAEAQPGSVETTAPPVGVSRDSEPLSAIPADPKSKSRLPSLSPPRAPLARSAISPINPAHSMSPPITHPLSAHQPARSLSLLFHLAPSKSRQHNFAIRTQSQNRTLNRPKWPWPSPPPVNAEGAAQSLTHPRPAPTSPALKAPACYHGINPQNGFCQRRFEADCQPA